jgi:hypothetical protein
MAAQEARKVQYPQRQQYLEQSGDVQYATDFLKHFLSAISDFLILV